MSRVVSASGVSDVGLVRLKNEDAWDVDLEHNLFLLADGIGGHRAGDIAATKTVELVRELLIEGIEEEVLPKNFCRLLLESFQTANEELFSLSRRERKFRGMGTTLCALLIYGDRAYFAHVGDSRIYLYREGCLERLTDDHSLAAEMARKGLIREGGRREKSYKSIVTRAIAIQGVLEPVVNNISLEPGDRFLLCSDGLTDLVADGEIEPLIDEEESAEKIAQDLVSMALSRGGADNITVLVAITE